MRIFVDTGAWMALEITNDQYYLRARAYYQKATKGRTLFFTNDYVLDEVYTRLIYDVHLKAAQEFHQQILSAVDRRQLVILEVGDKDRQLAWQILHKYSDHEFSFTDATIVAQITELHLDEIFTFDKHFREINLSTSLDREY